MTVTRDIEKILMDITGQVQPEVAIKVALSDVVAHRLEIVHSEMAKYEKRYHSTFHKFKKVWEEGGLKKKYSYSVEKDYWEWEALESRKKKLEEIAKWIG